MDAAHIVWKAETVSTNIDLLADAARGAPEWSVVAADHQTGGRGRLGRTWEAPAASALLMSVLLRPPAAAVHHAVTAVGCAAAAACAAIGFEPDLKWPNDLVARDRKLGGILAESTRTGNVTAVVVGLGLNVRRPPDRPSSLQDVAIDLEDLVGSEVDRRHLLDVILDELAPRYRQLVGEGPAALLDEYRGRCITIGQRVRVEQPGGVLEGDAVGIADDGSLTVSNASGAHRVDVGDVIHLRGWRPST